MAQKIYDVVAKTGEYTDRNTGQVKGKWQNVGAMIQGNDGSHFLVLERWFNPAGLPNPENRESVILSLFDPNRQQVAPQQGQPQGYGQPPQGQPPQVRPPAAPGQVPAYTGPPSQHPPQQPQQQPRQPAQPPQQPPAQGGTGAPAFGGGAPQGAPGPRYDDDLDEDIPF